MFRDRSELSDVVITWPAGSPRIATIIRTGRCPSYAEPRLAKPGAKVALVEPSGSVMAVFRIATVEHGQSILGANGKRYENGCVLVARQGSARRPGRQDHSHLSPPRWIGAIHYFDEETGERVWYGGAGPEAEIATPTPEPSQRLVRLVPYRADNTGRILDKPEALLVQRYVSWLGGSQGRFRVGQLAGVQLKIDLFVRGIGLLIEAKAYGDRDAVRFAVGQIYDYRRFFRRPPRLAVLLPARPARDVEAFLESRNIGCIWETKTGRFGDSRTGQLTSSLQRPVAG